MEFCFDVDPKNDLALGVETSFDEETMELEESPTFDLTGYNPLTPTEAKPGSEDKVRMLAARYSAGVPLWHDSDCYDHGPGGVDPDLAEAIVGADDDDLDIEEEE